jgi:hypothetical protein
MDLKQTGLGVLLFVVFFAFQAGVVNMLGPVAWLLGVIIFSIVLWLIGRVSMPRRAPPQLMELWRFTTLFAIVSTAIVSLGYPLLASMMPSGISMTQATSFVLGSWLIIFGAAMFVTGWTTKWLVTAVVGIIWTFSAVYFATGLPGYFHFALVTGLPFIIYGLTTKD